MILTSSFHSPVLLAEVLEGLSVSPGKKYIDATIGGGGHTDQILKLGGLVLGIDQDIDAINYLKRKYSRLSGIHDAVVAHSSQTASGQKNRPKADQPLAENINNQIGRNLFLAHGNFSNLKKIADKFRFKPVSGILFDLGMSSYQLEKSGRGFSWQRDEPLDMRMDETSGITAADILNSGSNEALYEIFSKYSEELNSGTISRAIFRARTIDGQIKRTIQLVAIIEKELRKIYPSLLPFEFEKIRSGVLSRIFQALRIKVNDEIKDIKLGLSHAIDLLATGGRLVVISFHSIEDRIVKINFKQAGQQDKVRLITKQPIVAQQREIATNYRSRSAKLRIVEKI